MKKISTNIYRRRYRGGRVVWVVRWWDEAQQKWLAVKGGDSKNEAKVAEGQLRQEILQGIDPVASRMQKLEGTETVSDLIQMYYTQSLFLNKAPHWKRTTKCRLDGLISTHLGQVKCREIKREQILSFYMVLKAKNYAHRTIKQYHFTLCQVFEVFVEKYPGQVNPIRAIRDFKRHFSKQAPTRDINFLTPEEIEDLLAEVKQSTSSVLLPFIQLLVYTGLRRTECLDLKWTDIDEKSGFIHVRNSKNGESRTIPLEPKAKETFELLNRRTLYLITRPDGDRFNPGSFLRPLKRAAKRAKIAKRIDIHTLRHSYGSNKIRQGWGLKKVSSMLGHSDISITAKTYSHLLDGDLKVRDEFHFDKSASPENSVGYKIENVELDPEKIIKMIQSLQATLATLPKKTSGATPAVPRAVPYSGLPLVAADVVQGSRPAVPRGSESAAPDAMVPSVREGLPQEVGHAVTQAAEIQKDSESFVKIRIDSTMTSKMPPLCYANATHMMEKRNTPLIQGQPQVRLSFDFISDNSVLALLNDRKKMVHPPRFERGTLSSED